MGESVPTERVKPSGLKTWIMISAILIPPIGYFLNLVMQGFGAWWNYPLIFPLPFFWNLIIIYMLSKLSGRLRLSPQELTLFFVICYITAGSYYAAQGIGYWTTTPITNWSIAHVTTGLNTETYKTVFYEKVPPFLVPKDPIVMNAFWYGGVFNLDPWIVPILFWIVWSVVEFSTLWFWGTMLIKPLMEVERLPFPWVMPVSFMINNFTSTSNGKPNLFNLKIGSTKFFYIGLIIGMLLSIPGQVINFWPLAFGGNALANWPVNLLSITTGPLPGALMVGNFYVIDAFSIGQLIPLDVLATATIWWFIWGVLFQTAAVRLGINPFTPGAGNEYQYAYSLGVFKWAQFDALVSVGIALYVVFKYYKYILEVLRKGIGGEGGDVGGISYRLMAFGALGTLLIQIVLFAVAGTPIVMAIFIPLFYVFIMFAWIRMMGEQHFYPYGGAYQGIVFDVGTFLGQWGGRPSPDAFNAMLMYTSLGLAGSRMSPMNIHWGFMSFKIGEATNTSYKEILYIALISIVTTAVAAYFLWPWFMTSFGGYSRINSIQYDVWMLPTIYSYTYGSPPAVTVAETWTYTIVGTIFVFACYTLRSRFRWFFINPVGLMMLPEGFWPSWLVAFIVKYAVLKFGGSRVFEEKWMPIAMGIGIGFGALVLFGALITFFNVSLPTWLGRF